MDQLANHNFIQRGVSLPFIEQETLYKQLHHWDAFENLDKDFKLAMISFI
jgi:hypothetical protein